MILRTLASPLPACRESRLKLFKSLFSKQQAPFRRHLLSVHLARSGWQLPDLSSLRLVFGDFVNLVLSAAQQGERDQHRRQLFE